MASVIDEILGNLSGRVAQVIDMFLRWYSIMVSCQETMLSATGNWPSMQEEKKPGDNWVRALEGNPVSGRKYIQ